MKQVSMKFNEDFSVNESFFKEVKSIMICLLRSVSSLTELLIDEKKDHIHQRNQLFLVWYVFYLIYENV